jgi:FXSXX-COOH protein
MSDDIADGALLDVSGLSLTELLNELGEGSLTKALHRIFASGEEGTEHYGFQSTI